MFSRTMLSALGAGLLAVAGLAPAASAQDPPPVQTVNTVANNGPGSLRSAINAANNTDELDEIHFDIDGEGVHVITPATQLPLIEHPLSIRGYTQDGADPAVDELPGTPTIVINASQVSRGLDIASDDVEVRGLVIRDAQSTGIYAEGSGIVIAGNHIGTNAAGDGARPNGFAGVEVVGSDNVVGGPDPKDRNVISSNPTEVSIVAGSGSVVENNRIGTNALGTGALGGAFAGVEVESDGNVVRDNVVADAFHGVFLASDDNTVRGNKLGTGYRGLGALPNGFGVTVAGGDRNLIDGNLLSGNDHSGAQMIFFGDAAEENVLQSNLIGTDAGGLAPLPNGNAAGFAAVMVHSANDNTIGGEDPELGNVISGNTADGIEIIGEGADNNRVIHNWIGTDATGEVALGNGESGVDIDGGDQNRIGDTIQHGNTIAHNGHDGVTVRDGTGNSIRVNSIYSNALLGIDLGADGPTANDGTDGDSGPNQLQNGLDLDGVEAGVVDWELESVPNTDYRIEFFVSDACDSSGSGEGQTFVDAIVVRTDNNGEAEPENDAAPLDIEPGKVVTATVTKIVGGGVPRSTSEFSPCETSS
jgi:Right handed beta helix region